ncbi:MAG TPA: xanthine dehydrogenase family protein molybdopterin-binding subunit [Methylomirabilota bacterium]|jgi:carbon-monoxide dehydrogenase large subunit|nr:xanthine dehydrogenase family protein molybdopterin-binding subunit [Methylomirabilota bacterium]
MAESTDHRYIGRALKRVEDRRLLTGVGRYVDDFRPPGLVHVAFVRSDHAHARIRRLDVTAARAAPGVVAVVTGAEVRHLGPLPVIRLFPDMKVPPHAILAADVVRAVGVPVVAVAAESAYQARDAAELIEVDYDPLPAVVEPKDALAADAPVIFPELGTNRSFSQAWRQGDAAAAFASAARVVKLRVVQQRLSAVAMEPRAVLAAFDPATDELTLWSSTQAPFAVRAEIARILGLSESKVRAIAPEVGGGFGVKTAPYGEDVLVAYLSMRLGRPVAWIASRREDLLTTQHGRGAVAEGELAVAADGRITALRGRVVYPLGSSLVNSAAVSPWNHARLLPGAYVVPACDIETAGVFTTTAPIGAYRGAGRPEAAFLIERLVDQAARALGMDPAELRRRNLVPADRFPFRTVTGQVYDSGDYPRALDRALEAAGYERLRQEQAAARARGEIVGIGLASYIEPSALGWESGSVRVERTGSITAVTGSSPHGQGHETTFAQIVADFLGVVPEEVVVLHGDTRSASQGFGTFGSRSVALGGGALASAAVAVREQGKRVAAALLEAKADDVVGVPGGFQVAGVPARQVSWKEVAAAAHAGRPPAPGITPGLDATVFFQPDGEAWSFGSVVAVVRVDRETGQIALAQLVWVDDGGTIVNPLLAEGQLHGGFAQGFGQVFLEQIVYDAAGQLLTGTLMDYAVPRAEDVPEPHLEKTLTPSPRNPLGAKGIGEAGCIAVPPAIVNAVVDALTPFGVTHLDMPLTPEKVWRALRGTREA